jgi:hypothetical protein
MRVRCQGLPSTCLCSRSSQINNVNSILVEQNQLIMSVNTCCGVPPAECGTKHSVFDRVMRSTNVSLNADVSPPVEERQISSIGSKSSRPLWSNFYPGLPNATSVQQETDQNYGPFKGVVCDNLKKMSSAFYAAGLTIPLNMMTFGLIVYGGTIPVGPSTTVTCRNALAETFDVASNLTSWREVGAVPHTRKCLTNSKVRHDGTDKRDPNFDIYQDIQSQNDFSTAQLNLMGFRGDVLRAVFRQDKISERKASQAVTVANTCERQEAIAAANTHGSKFFVTGGST